jgi:hypothetical protein
VCRGPPRPYISLSRLRHPDESNRSRVGADTRLASWAGTGPGHDERAGKRRRGRTRQGHRSLRGVLVPCAWAARNTLT